MMRQTVVGLGLARYPTSGSETALASFEQPSRITRRNSLPIGGVKEKMLAAYRAGIRTLLLPQENKKDLEDVPEHVRKVFDIILVENIGDVLKVALLPKEN